MSPCFVRGRVISLPPTRLPFCNTFLVRWDSPAGERFIASSYSDLDMPRVYVLDRDGNGLGHPIPGPSAGCAYMARPGTDGRIYVGLGNGDLGCLDPATGAFERLVSGLLKSIIWAGSAVAANGMALVSSAHYASTVIYDTRQRRLVRFIERLCEDPDGHYLQGHVIGTDGLYYFVVNSPQGQVVVWDPTTNELRRVVPDWLRGHTWAGPVVLVEPDLALVGNRWLARLPGMELVAEAKDPPKYALPTRLGRWTYAADSATGRLARMGPDLTWQTWDDRLDYAGCALSVSQGRDLVGVTHDGVFLRIEPDSRAMCQRQLDNLGHVRLDCLERGPGNRVFGTTFINMRFHEVDTETGEGRDLGRAGPSTGEVLATAWFRDRLYMASYTSATVTEYDPAKPGRFPQNPRLVASIRNGQKRPRGMVSDGRFLYVITLADYGTLGGALSRFDPETGELQVHRNVVPNQNPTSLVFDPERRLLFVGCTIGADCASARPTERAARFFAWDTLRQEKAYDVEHPAGGSPMTVLAILSAGILLGGMGNACFRWDVIGRRFLETDAPFPWGDAPRRLLAGPGGAFYALTAKGIFRWEPASGLTETVADDPAIHTMLIRGRTLFYARPRELCRVELA